MSLQRGVRRKIPLRRRDMTSRSDSQGKRPLHVGALGAPDGLEALEGLALVFKPEE